MHGSRWLLGGEVNESDYWTSTLLSTGKSRGGLADLDAGVEHPFGASTGYELVHQGKRYPPKAVIGLAFQHSSGVLPHEPFSGEAPGQSNFVLRGLGFTVEMEGETVAEPAETKKWTAQEVSLLVADYFVLRASVRRHRSLLELCRTDSRIVSRTCLPPGIAHPQRQEPDPTLGSTQQIPRRAGHRSSALDP
jgi:hypothetical protein